jgi:hypothetical protein
MNDSRIKLAVTNATFASNRGQNNLMLCFKRAHFFVPNSPITVSLVIAQTSDSPIFFGAVAITGPN